MTDELVAARFVAQYWLDSVMGSAALRGTGMSHPLAMVIAALDGERDPTRLGLSAEAHYSFSAALAKPAEGLDANLLSWAMNSAYTYEDIRNSIPTLPFIDDMESFWEPFAAKVARRLGEQP